MTEKSVEELTEHLVDLEQDLQKTLKSVLSLAEQMADQAAVLKGIMFILEATLSMQRIHHQRLNALEERARGLSFEDIVDGKEMTPLGPTQEHFEILTKLNAGLDRLNEEMTKVKDDQFMEGLDRLGEDA